MVICPVCNKENNDEEYCTDCGAKLVETKKDSIFKFDDNRDISQVNELNIYLKELNEKIDKQKKFLNELNNDPLIKKYETISKINDENIELKKKIQELELDKERVTSDLKRQKKLNSQLQSEINDLRRRGNVTDVIRGIFEGNKNRGDTNFCPNCGYKLY